jgi:carbonic anhydrase
MIRNAGGRVTPDVLRSLAVCQDLLGCNTILVIHHTDCGGQASLCFRWLEGMIFVDYRRRDPSRSIVRCRTVLVCRTRSPCLHPQARFEILE